MCRSAYLRDIGCFVLRYKLEAWNASNRTRALARAFSRIRNAGVRERIPECTCRERKSHIYTPRT